ncbi:MAG: phospholipase [Muribaculaceae bacterium]|jgi:hypothetical protein
MIVFLIILAALVGVGLPLYLLHRADEKRAAKNRPGSGDSTLAMSPEPSPTVGDGERAETDGAASDDDEVCCGLHMTCEKDSLLADVSQTIDYFDDEELDRFAGRGADSYSPQETEEFRDVLLTLLPADIAPWARSIQLRGITLPSEVREELLMIVAEARKEQAT